jgi:hypothetical protein
MRTEHSFPVVLTFTIHEVEYEYHTPLIGCLTIIYFHELDNEIIPA